MDNPAAQEATVIKSTSLWFVVLAVALSAGCGDERSVNLSGLWVPDGEIACVADPPLVREPTTGDGPADADGMGREPTLLDGETVALQYQLSHVGNTVTVTLYVDGYEGLPTPGLSLATGFIFPVRTTSPPRPRLWIFCRRSACS